MCCLFGLIDYRGTLTAKQKTRLIRELSIAAEVRGTDATGIAYNTEHGLQIYKRPLPAHRMRLNIPSSAKVIMGHTRMATQGRAKKNENNHPFRGSIEDRQFALAHNGVLYNDYQLRRLLHLPASKIETDSYIAVQLIEQKNTLDPSSLKYMAEQVEGSFAFTVLTDRDGLYFVKGDSPLCLVLFPFDAAALYCNHWGCYSFPLADHHPQTERESVRVLKSIAATFGYTDEMIDRLLERGFTTDEVEEWLYCGAF